MKIFRHKLLTPRSYRSSILPSPPIVELAHSWASPRFAAAIAARPAMLLVNGIFCPTPNGWQVPMCNWGNANAPQWSWNYAWYAADALLTGLFFSSHADAVANAIDDLYVAGAPFVDIIAHSEGNEVSVEGGRRSKHGVR